METIKKQKLIKSIVGIALPLMIFWGLVKSAHAFLPSRGQSA
jgi:hypothetical protein